ALQLKWLALIKGDVHEFRLARDGHSSADPIDRVWVQRQLLRPRRSVVEHRHLLLTDNNESLFLERVQPTHEDVRVNAARKRDRHQAYVGDARAEVGAPPASDRLWRDAQEPETEGNVVGREAPKSALLCAN